MAKLLLDENPLVIQPSLAATLGLNEAIVVQQLHYWLNKTDFIRDGRKWVYNTMTGWHNQLFFWSLKTVDRTFKNLIQMGVVLVANYNRSKIDKTLWYSIDYDVLTGLVDDYLYSKNMHVDCNKKDLCDQFSSNDEYNSPSSHNDQIEDTKLYFPSGQSDLSISSSCLIHLDNLGGTIPENTTENITENINQSVLGNSRSTDRLNSKDTNFDTSGKDDEIAEIEKIISNCSLEIIFDNDMANAITMALQNLYFNTDFAQNNLKLPLEVVRERMRNLNGNIIEFAVQKMQKAAAYGTKIGSPTNYLQSCIFNAISEYTTYLLSDEYLSRLSIDKKHMDIIKAAPDKETVIKREDEDVKSLLDDVKGSEYEDSILEVAAEIGEVAFNNWILPLRVAEIDKRRIKLKAHDNFIAAVVKSKYKEMLLSKLVKAGVEELEIVLEEAC